MAGWPAQGCGDRERAAHRRRGYSRWRTTPWARVDWRRFRNLRAAWKKRLSLDRGQLHAFMGAAPGDLTVDTPFCGASRLELRVNAQRGWRGRLRLFEGPSRGWVAFAVNQAGELSLPRGGVSASHAEEGGPGIPVYEMRRKRCAARWGAFDARRFAAL